MNVLCITFCDCFNFSKCPAFFARSKNHAVELLTNLYKTKHLPVKHVNIALQPCN